MPHTLTMARAGRLAAIAVMGLVLAACSSKESLTGADLAITGSAASAGSTQEFVVSVGDRVFFNTDSAEFTPQAIATLNRQVQWLRQYPQYSFVIEGHADERGTREYNIALGARRATAVRDYFAARGVAASRMRVISYGKERPVAVCNDISCWSQNRRAVVVLNTAGV
ncbi:peptidoglycan-associated lipoprotein Pal [Bauldia sp.]|uniref:peptidoglycan-associated lipoprotein Pal n=1 Tax=Bauldia sp. TaxID=2575872 RepID=UPI003BAC73B5